LAICVAVLDDDPAFLAFLGEVLADAGYAPALVHAGVGVDKALRRLAPEAIVLDIPARDPAASWRILTMIARDDSPRGVPLVVCADGTPEVEKRLRTLLRQDDIVLPKPFELAELLTALGRVGRKLRARAYVSADEAD